jgi:hypothetical protein
MLTDEQRNALEVAADTLIERFAAPIRALLSASKPAVPMQSREAAAEIVPSHFVQGGIAVKLLDQSLPVGAKLYTAPQPSQPAQAGEACTYPRCGCAQACSDRTRSAVVLDDERAAFADGFFVYDPNGGHVEFYDTDAQRAEAHEEAIGEYRKDSISDGEWSLDVEKIVSGIVTHKTVAVNDDGETCDYSARAASPQATATHPAQTERALTDERIMHIVRYSTVGSNAIAPDEWCAFARALLAAQPELGGDRG